MTSNTPLVISDSNLSRAWSRLFLHIIDNTGKEVSPVLVSIIGFEGCMPDEDQGIKTELDYCLELSGLQKVQTVANTIFPESLWRASKYDRNILFAKYKSHVPRYKALSKKNRRGIYFERLINFGRGPNNGNQLEFIIEHYMARPRVRRSLLQASVFDPGRDHIGSAQLGFPCLQHISFTPSRGVLFINAFYATQQVLERAYGNFLGLCRLGKFMSQQMELKFGGLNCFIGVEKLDDGIKKSEPNLSKVIETSRKILT
jgi:hypothetical protein